MRWVRRILLLVLLVALPVGVHLFVTRNAAEVPLDFLAVRFESVAVWVALLCAFGAGAVLAALVAVLRGARLRLETRRYRKVTRDLESEVHQLRNLPLAPEAPGGHEGGGELAKLAALERGT
jgi:uncharacterized integral membrane protein